MIYIVKLLKIGPCDNVVILNILTERNYLENNLKTFVLNA